MAVQVEETYEFFMYPNVWELTNNNDKPKQQENVAYRISLLLLQCE